MISRTVNLTTGPVLITAEVRKALGEIPVSHRSQEFRKLFDKTAELLRTNFSVKEVFLLTGSGTLANEAMLQEIKYAGGTGLILSNGEFGSRLIEQATRNGINFITCQLTWGDKFDPAEVEKLLVIHSIKWILFCHCETSTGVINDLEEIAALAKTYNCMCFVDCMSTVGTRPLDLSKITMATASSGKGLASVPGLAIVFSNKVLVEKKEVPVCIDLSHYSRTKGVPFTISSNLVKALYVSIRQKLVKDQFELAQEYCNRFSRILGECELTPFNSPGTRVYTIAPPQTIHQKFIEELKHQNLLLSYESDYLKARNWCQLAMFGYYTEADLKYVSNALSNTVFKGF